MDALASRWWLRIAVLAAIVYAVVGIAFAAFAKFSQMPAAWRLAAWLVSAATFAVHIGYEHFRLPSSPPREAWHAALAVALGAFALAVWINVHAYWTEAGHPRPLMLLGLVLFPLVTGAPAFLVALAATAVLARTGR